MVCVNSGLANLDKRFPKRIRLNAFLIGDPGLAKTPMLEKAAKLVPSSQIAGGQSSTGLSLTAQVSREKGGAASLMVGPIVMAKNAICAINELGQMPREEQKHLLDCMEEDGFHLAKYGFSTFIEAHPSVIAAANPVKNTWQNSQSITLDEFPLSPQTIQRFDLIFVFRENIGDDGRLRLYLEKKKEVADNYKKGMYDGNDEFIKKYLLYAKTFEPDLTEVAYNVLQSSIINMGKAGISDLSRKLDSLIRITVAIAKLKLKAVAEVEDAEEAALFYSDTLRHFSQSTLPGSMDMAYREIKQVIWENNGESILLQEAVTRACERNQDVKYYLLGKGGECNPDSLKLSKSWRLKGVLCIVRQDNHIQITSEKPIMLRWKAVGGSATM